MISKFVTLTPYCIMEYMLTPLGDPDPILLTSNYYAVKNSNNNSLQIYNTDEFRTKTNNSRDLSVVAVGGSKFVYNDMTLLPPYTDYDTNITLTELDPQYSTNLVIDKVRVHFASGFDFTEFENLIFGVKQTMNDSRQLILANLLLDFQTAQDIFSYNTRPLFIANTIYDKYVDITIPSMAQLNDDYTQFGDESFEYQVTEGVGLVKNAPIKVFLIEVNYEEYNADNNVTYDRYKIVNYYETAVAQSNMFDSLGCMIEEANDGDYIRFFATWNGAFPDSLIGMLNQRGPDQDWIFTHQLQVYEQIGSDLVPSGNFTIYQETEFDTPLLYRPILKEAGFAVAMSIDYTLRLLNKKTGEQVIRTGALTVVNPNKYGKQLARIVLPDGPQSMKVYNKIAQKNYEVGFIFPQKNAQTTVTNGNTGETAATKVITRTAREYLPIKQGLIRASQANALLSGGNFTDQVVYGQGKLIIPIDPADNFIKLTVYSTNPADSTKQEPVDLNDGSDFKLVFGKTNDYSFSLNTELSEPARGQLAFKIPAEKANQLLSTKDKLFNVKIVSKVDNTETVLYTGSWIESSSYSKIAAAEEEALLGLANEATIANLQAQITSLQAKNESLTAKLTELTAPVAPSQPQTNPNLNAASALPGRNSTSTA